MSNSLNILVGGVDLFINSVAAVCWISHYAKRILETLFVHRFSHATMPLRNLFRNSAYYWIFAAYVAYHINHPLYTAPCQMQSYIAFGCWTVSFAKTLYSND